MKGVILTVGDTPKQLRDSIGSLEYLVESALPKGHHLQIESLRNYLYEPGAEADYYIISGAFLSIIEDYEWKKNTLVQIKKLVLSGKPVLGICFGHQIMAASMGGRVVVNPAGLEFGVSNLSLTKEGKSSPCFRSLEGNLSFYQSHYDVVLDIPPESGLILAENEYGIQAIQYGKNGLGVQFHPEFSGETLRKLANYFQLSHYDLGEASRNITNHNRRQILLNYFEHVVKGM